MDFFAIIIICLVAFVIFALCGYCCKRSSGRGTVISPPVTITTAHVTATPIVQPPYPTDVRHPVPQSMHAPMNRPVGFGDYPAGYQTTPYPPAPGQSIAPYPPAQAPPPSYNEAVSQPVVLPPPVTEHYAKQSPYNPNY